MKREVKTPRLSLRSRSVGLHMGSEGKRLNRYGRGEPSIHHTSSFRLQGRARIRELVVDCVYVPRFKLEVKVESMASYGLGAAGLEVEEQASCSWGGDCWVLG